MSFGNSSTKPLKVLMMPDYRIDNPYQKLLSKSLETQGVEVLFPDGYRRLFPLYRAIKSHQNIDILHIHWTSPYLKGKNIGIKSIYVVKFLIDIILTKWAGVKVVWTYHNHVSHDSKSPILEHWLQLNLFSLVDKIILHNYSIVKDTAKKYDFAPSKVEVIPHGHYREIYGSAVSQLEARKALGIPLTGRVYLNLGMLRSYKGLEKLLLLWTENHDFFQEHTLLIAGKALDVSYLQTLTKLAEAAKGVILHPDFIEGNKIHLYFSAADIVVLPFKKVLTSGSLLLAMSYNKPIIAPQTNVIAETLGSADCLLYEDTDTQGLFKALKCSNQIDLSKLSDLVKYECDKLDWEDIGLKTYNVYNQVLGNHMV